MLGCGAVGFTIKILLDHIKDADAISDQIFATKNQISEFGEKLSAEELETNALKEELSHVELDVKTKQSTVQTLQSQVNKRKSELEKQGKFKLDG